MRLAAIMSCRHPLGTDSARALADDRELVAELQGSVDVLVLEHGCHDGEHWNLNPISYAAYLAEYAGPLGAVVRALTPGVMNPVWLAEQLATLDHAWAGRFAAGVILAPPGEFVAHSKDPDLAMTRFEESLVILHKMWSGEPFSADGKTFRFEEVRPTLVPYNAGGPPVSLAITDVDGAVLAAQQGLNLHLRASAAGSADALISAYQLAGGAGEVSVEVPKGAHVGVTLGVLDRLGVAQADLRLPAAGAAPDHAKTVAEFLATAGSSGQR